MTMHRAPSVPKNHSEFVSSDIVRAQKRKQSLRRKSLVGLSAGLAAFAAGYLTLELFGPHDVQARVPHLQRSAAPAQIEAALAGGNSPDVLAAQQRIARSQAELRHTMTRFQAEQDALSRLMAGDGGAVLFSGAAGNAAASEGPKAMPLFQP